MSATDALTITSAPDALTRYYNAKEREESAVLYINDAYLEALNSLENLEAENARLLEERDYYKAMWEHATVTDCELRRVRAAWKDDRKQNAKLRELVRDLWKACPAYGYYCIYHCEHYNKESESHCKLEDRMTELGIEVDDGTE